ncbi:type 2 isopentenyl-diphosphate Delta-isomerase [Planctomycetota bacterium]
MATEYTTSAEPTPLRRRKGRHLSVCVDPQDPIEGRECWFHEIRFVHHPLAEIDCDTLDLRTTFQGEELTRPFFISCMTGGSEAGARANKNLVRAAQATGIPVGLGSMRVLLREPELFDHFYMKPLAPDVPVWANLGVGQLNRIALTDLVEWLKRLEVQSLVLHCNPGQEQFQPDGDRCFTGILEQIKRLCEQSPIPIVVKETGFGLRPQDIAVLVDAGVNAVDIAGSGGTNWVLVESQCHPDTHAAIADDYRDWGNPTPLVLAAIEQAPIPVLASGGLRNGIDIAKSLALGATLAGLALPFAKIEHNEGLDGVIRYIEELTQSLKTTMLLTGSHNVADLSRAGLILSDRFAAHALQYRNGGDWRTLLRHGEKPTKA